MDRIWTHATSRAFPKLHFAGHFASPGVTDDRNAVRHCGLDASTEMLPFGVCIIGDCACEATEHLVPVCQGLDGLNPACDNFNFCASQLQIRVEMAFRLMQIKWGILQRPIGCSIMNLKWLIQAIGRLHNFVINERLQRKKVRTNDAPAPNCGDDDAECEATGHLPSAPHDENGDVIDLNPLTSATAQRGYSELRERMVHRVATLGSERPSKNCIGKRKNMDDPFGA